MANGLLWKRLKMNAKNDSDYKRKCLALLDTLGGMELPVYLDVYRKIAVGGGVCRQQSLLQ